VEFEALANDPSGSGRHPRIDIATVRETVALMHDDLAGTPALERVRTALGNVLREIDGTAGPAARAVRVETGGNVVRLPFLKLVRWTPGG
jgi:hypothetical protein